MQASNCIKYRVIPFCNHQNGGEWKNQRTPSYTILYVSVLGAYSTTEPENVPQPEKSFETAWPTCSFVEKTHQCMPLRSVLASSAFCCSGDGMDVDASWATAWL